MTAFPSSSMRRQQWRESQPYDAVGQRKRALALRGYCKRHKREYRLNVLVNGVVTANGCPQCYAGYR